MHILTKMNILKFFLFFFTLLELFSCNQNKNTKNNEETTTTGTICVSVDESLRPLMEAELNVFGYLYADAHIKVSFKPEAGVMNDFKNDSARAIIVTRELTANEMAYFRSIQYIPIALPFAKDGISVIVNKKNRLDSFTVADLKQILTDKWTKKMLVVFDNSASSTVRWLTDSLLKKEVLAKNCFAVETNPEVIKYISEHENAIGIIGTSWISDKDDSAVTLRLSTIKRARIAAAGSVDYLEPFQSEIQTERYALARMVYVIQRDGKLGLGTGLQHFLFSEKGQMIVLKFGLMPYTQPERSIHLNLN